MTTAASETVDANGSWTTQMSGTGTAEEIYTVDVNSTMEGTFSGNTSSGEWIGTYNASYQISPLGIDEQDSGEISGTYMMTIDESGVISGNATAQVSDVLTGGLQLTINGTESESGELNGTLSSTLNGSTISYGGTPVPLGEMMLNISGEFEGVAQREGPTPSPGVNIINFVTIPSTDGKIIFDGMEYQNGDNVSKEEGNYAATADIEGFLFSGWETFGNISMAEYTMVSTTCTVSGNGTLRLVLAGSGNTTSPPPPTTTPPPQSGCLIVTATFGTEMAPEVIFMRHVRDDMIGSNEVGRILIVGWNNFYYSWSPTIAEIISNSEMLRSASNVLLVPLIAITHNDRCSIFHSFSSQSNSFINSSISIRSRIIDNNLHADAVYCNSQNL
ncbi:hypothetical protein A3K80_03080 [Candidatus Bathyarchaeota archaeon RBG_13_38_9]|nr:MAG: hypothetical protein A3K80_03080 [Candidatus Bathyarchaeota archaeon RBG_13_38_9]